MTANINMYRMWLDSEQMYQAERSPQYACIDMVSVVSSVV